ncbi:hypothetical protein D9758_007070 [Tetrapyrgos nigripes]|uniref:Alpha-type protein kinase domain-containing protein n=1 Tax=Tetrapyrgos nigripes TaxID=182062 RepID=A0A8H5GDG1_9AGAR|nr:hypothetical protein D9758_007070 [Tetrapyrgos nigripes]
MKNKPQCIGCGAIASRMKGDKCGRCKLLELQTQATVQELNHAQTVQPPALPSQAVPPPPQTRFPPVPTQSLHPTVPYGSQNQNPLLTTQHAAMSQSFMDTMNQAKQCKALVDAASLAVNYSNMLSPVITPNEMLELRESKGNKSGVSIMVYCHPRVGRKEVVELMPEYHPFDAATLMHDVKAHWLECLNLCWQFLAPGKLQLNEVELCWPDYFQLGGTSQFVTIGAVHDSHLHLEGFNMKFLRSPADQASRKKLSGGGKFMQLALNIKIAELSTVHKVEARYGQLLPKELGGSGPSRAKAKCKQINDDADISSSTVAPASRFTGPPMSTFRQSQCAIFGRTAGFKPAVISEIKLSFATDVTNNDSEDGDLFFSSNTIVSTTISSSSIGNGLSKSVFQSINSLPLQLDMSFTDVILARETSAGPDGQPSVASGLSGDAICEDATWLIEPRCTTEVIKSSGMMQQVDKNNLVFKTINVFTHYVYYCTDGVKVLVDLQGTLTAKGYVLFDPMAHTKEGDSCMGDMGDKGLQAVVDQHNEMQCNNICLGLQLPPMMFPFALKQRALPLSQTLPAIIHLVTVKLTVHVPPTLDIELKVAVHVPPTLNIELKLATGEGPEIDKLDDEDEDIEGGIPEKNVNVTKTDNGSGIRE